VPAPRAFIRPILFVTALFVCLALVPAAHAAFPGPNGRLVVVSNRDGDAEILTMSADGSDVRQLTRNDAYDADPAVSPDGRQIAFFSDRDGNHEIYVMNADGTHERRLTNSLERDFQPSFSPDGNKIVFVSETSPSTTAVRVMGSDGSSPGIVVACGLRCLSPSFRPDGRKILYYDNDGYIQTRNPDGSVLDYLFRTISTARPSYSPDGQRIVFDQNSGGGDRDIYACGQEVSGAFCLSFTLITAGSPLRDDFPSFSPDGKKIIYRCQAPDRDLDICTINPDGSGNSRIPGTGSEEFQAVWMVPSAYDDATRPALTLGNARANKRKGTATVDATVSRSGKLLISGRGVGSE
jgi:TolB protein